jgi:hypothetical protein
MAQACLPSTQSTRQAQCNPVICMFAKRTLTENENTLSREVKFLEGEFWFSCRCDKPLYSFFGARFWKRPPGTTLLV